MKKIYIGTDYNGYILGIVLADNKDLAKAFFIGTDEGLPYHIEEIDLESDIIKSLPLFNIVKAYKMPIYKLRDNHVDNVYLCKR